LLICSPKSLLSNSASSCPFSTHSSAVTYMCFMVPAVLTCAVEAEGQKSLREVELGLITGTQAEIISGVKEGDIVIYDHPAAAASTPDSSANQSPPPGIMMGPGAGGPGRMR
jgi:hypothetical protein